MKRGLTAGFLLLVMILWPARAKQEGIPKENGARAKASIQWETVDGSRVLRLWQVEGPQSWPQITVMRVSNATYQKYFQDPKKFVKFVNVNKFFSKDVITAGPWVTLSVGVAAEVPGNDVGPDWILGRADQALYAAKRLGRNRVISAETMLADFARLHPKKIAPPNPARTA